MNKNKILYSLFISVGLSDIFIWVLIMNPPRPGILLPIVLLSIRGLFGFMLFAFIKYETKYENAGILGLFTFIFFYIFSIMGIVGIFFVLNDISKGSKKSSLYHIDNEEGENIEESSDPDKQAFMNFDEMREVAPLADGMVDDKTIVRIATIQAMEALDVTHIRNVLVDSKSDKSKDVQYFAQEALTKISDTYMRKIKELTDIVNNSEPNYEDYKKLADIYAEYAHKNIEHPILVEFYRKEAIKYYNDLLQNYPEQKNSILANLIPVLFENQNYKECIKYCDEIYNDPTLTSNSIKFKARGLFQTRDIGSLKKFAEKENKSNVAAINDFIELSNEEFQNG